MVVCWPIIVLYIYSNKTESACLSVSSLSVMHISERINRIWHPYTLTMVIGVGVEKGCQVGFRVRAVGRIANEAYSC